MLKTITLSDNQPCQVRVLGLFELDGVGREVMGPYRYSVLMATGQVMEDEYNIHAWPEPPKPPDIPVEEIEQGSYEWLQLREFETYQAAVAHERQRVDSYEDRLADISAYILEHCLEPDDHNRIVDPDDWAKVYAVAIVPALTEEVIADTLRDTFPGLVWQFGNFAGADVDSQGPG